MQFCTECGGALNLFESNDDQICWNCVRKKEKAKPQPPPVSSAPNELPDLDDAMLTVENNMIVLKAKEGWILWSGPISQAASIGTILKRARHIHKIRMKRYQHKN